MVQISFDLTALRIIRIWWMHLYEKKVQLHLVLSSQQFITWALVTYPISSPFQDI